MAMSDLQTDELGPRHQTEEATATAGSVQYEALVQTLDEYAALLNSLLSALNAAGFTSNRP
jgi:hypothetical protein